MTLAPGVRLGAYEIVSLLGAGGMGEVYRARDPRLGRDVAIKLLPAEFSSDADRLSRFEQEARAAAALNHPNILAVHDIGQHDRAPYIVSELLEGESIRGRLAAGALPVRKAVEYAIQVARGLTAAHDKGIVHRDLKPDNVFVTSDGHVKILDFGLAKLVHSDAALPAATDLPTTPPNTAAGLVLGTLGYMAPEQVRGLKADHRADIFAFGVVLYEMLSGRRAFHGQTAIDTITAILKEDPADLPIEDRHIPPALARIVDRCLEKNPAARFQTASDLGFALDALSTQSGHTDVTPIAAARSKPWILERLAWSTTGALVATAMIAAGILATRRAPDAAPSIRFSIVPPPRVSFTNVAAQGTPFSVSPDGRRMVVAGLRDGRQLLWVHEMDSLEARPLEGTQAAIPFAFWSPDSQRLGFLQAGQLKTMEASGGPLQTVSDMVVTGPGSGAWGSDGTIVFSAGLSGIFKVPAAGGQPVSITKPDPARGETSHRFPRFLPDGRRFIFVAFPTNTIWIGSVDGGEPTRLLSADSQADYSQGHLLFVRQGTLLAQAFDERSAVLTGDPRPIAEQIQSMANNNSAHGFSVSESGLLAYRTAVPVPVTQLVWMDRKGKSLGDVGQEGRYRNPALSPDGARIAIENHDSAGRTADIYVIELARGITSRLTFDARHDTYPVWSPDGKWVMFASDRAGAGGWNLYQKLASGAGVDELVWESKVDDRPYSWSPDGRYVAFRRLAGGSFMQVLPLFGDKQPLKLPVGAGGFGHTLGQISPDGRWMAYVSTESGRFEVYVRNFPTPGSKWQISKDGAVAPRWRGDSRELFYYAADGQMMAVPLEGNDKVLDVGIPIPLFIPRLLNGPTSPNGFRAQYDVTRDGNRFLVNLPVEQATPTPSITVVTNWSAALSSPVP